MRIRPRFIYFWLIAAWCVYLLFAGLTDRYGMIGLASWYGYENEGKLTASGEVYYPMKLTAAHRSLPFGTLVRVTRLKNNRSVLVKINDRGPGIWGRLIDLSQGAAQKLDMLEKGLSVVRVEIIR